MIDFLSTHGILICTIGGYTLFLIGFCRLFRFAGDED